MSNYGGDPVAMRQWLREPAVTVIGILGACKRRNKLVKDKAAPKQRGMPSSDDLAMIKKLEKLREQGQVGQHAPSTASGSQP